MTMPAQKPHRSKQDYSTPPAFITAVQRRFGFITFDLAANEQNSVAGSYFFGPGSRIGEDALTADWDHNGLGWLNPPFEKIGPWAKRCAGMCNGLGYHQAGRRVALLVPASVGSNWYAEHVAPNAYVFALRPRISFDGVAPYPKDLILALFEPAGYRGFEPWDWQRIEAEGAR